MINIRHGLFETNSSSVHSMTLLTQDEYDKWGSGDYYLDLDEGRVLSREEAETIVSEYVNKWGDEYPPITIRSPHGRVTVTQATYHRVWG